MLIDPGREMKLMDRAFVQLPLALMLTLMSIAATAQVPPPPDAAAVLSGAYTGASYSPYAERSFPTFPLWGDSHLHTDLSMDAGAFGNRLAPAVPR